MTAKENIVVIGAGSWGSALAIQFARNGNRTYLWGRDKAQMDMMATSRINQRYLPNASFPEALTPSADLPSLLSMATSVVVAVPSHVFRATIANIVSELDENCPISWATKGLEPKTGKLLHQVVEEEAGSCERCAVISGPTFALEVASGLPTAVTVGASNIKIADHFASLLHGHAFRAYTATDIVSIEIGGACKNVLAIAAGIADGLGYGANTRAALITRGLAEMVRLGVAMGGNAETMMGLAGLGDLVLTCTDNQSRNRRVGLGLGAGKPLEQVITEIGQAVEGVKSAPEIYMQSQHLGVEMPIVEQVYRVLYEGVEATHAVESLLGRSPKAEIVQ